MNEQQLKNIIEAAIFAAGEPLSIDRLLSLFEEEERPEKAQVQQALADLANDYTERGLELKEVSSGFRFQARSDTSRWVSRLWEERAPRYSRALLETLALVAYRQPITRAEIEDIRGVAVSTNIIKTLQEREWVRVVGHRDVPGKPAMYATTREFLDYFNLKSLDQLPPLSELKDLDKLNAELDLRLPGDEFAGGEEAAALLPAVIAPDMEPVIYD
jgi:segregation and condensation protein B